MNIQVIYSHSYQSQSRAGKEIISLLAKQPGVHVRNLEELYPDGHIDVATEQAKLLEADMIIFAHPTFWFNIPPMLKAWQDQVMTFGFAYGEGSQLTGKKFIHSYTTGANADFYIGGGNKEVIEKPQQLIAGFCGLNYLGAVGSYGFSHNVNDEQAKQMAQEHAKRLIALIG